MDRTRRAMAGLSLLLMVMALGGMPGALAEMPLVQPVNLRAEIEPSMFQGTVQSINATDSSVTIRTDFGRTVVLFSQDCRMADGLRSGDRVRLEPDATGLVTVTPMDRRRVGGEASLPEFSRHLAWAPAQCSEGVL